MGGTMDDGTKQQRRGNTRQRIQDVALELFAEQGYEKTSLREIAERLDVTKAALYYHFKTKEEITVSLFRDLTQPIEDLIEWGQGQPHTLETKQEIVRRYSEALAGAEPLFRFMQENQATVRELRIGETFKDRMRRLRDIIIDPEAQLTDQVRCISALFTLHAGMFVMQDLEGDAEKKRQAVLEVAVDLVTQAHEGARGRQ
ncbi:TetR/AcrR family transcriptional regulator [Streptomyces sp. LaPpAH-108]|uniref:TetR/AcrR family transcriptional regulator n=1 Tax=Streptomyces sp. LaPpAH-108 TaxID=1155714 RepID=UPI000367F80C|nr:TetR/AcrR family transcriptional regulator [Streptomyces sp. LaPpAH-108]